MSGRGKGGKGLCSGELIPQRAVKRLIDPETARELFRSIEYQKPLKRKKLEKDGDRKRNDHPWLNTLILWNVFEFLTFKDQLKFRLVNCAMSDELRLCCDEEAGDVRGFPWYGFQMMLKFERFSRELKKEESSAERSKKILYTLSGCLTRLHGEVRNVQVCNKSLIKRRNPFENYFIGGQDYNFEKLVENEEYVKLFKSGAVQFTEWTACTLQQSESSICELKIKRKSKDPNKTSFVYLYQSHQIGVNGRDGGEDESYKLMIKEEGSNITIPLMEYLFYRDPTGEGYTKKSKITKLMKSCEIPSCWSFEDFITFLMVCSNSFLITMPYSYDSLLTRIKTSSVFAENAEEDDEIEESEDEDEEEEEDEEEAHGREVQRMFNFEEDSKNLDNERIGKDFMSDLLVQSRHRNKTPHQHYYDLICLNRIVTNFCSVSNFSHELPEEYQEYVDVIKSKIVKFKQSVGFMVCIGEYVSQARSFALVKLKGEKETWTLKINLSAIQGYHSRFLTFDVEKDSHRLIDFTQDDYSRNPKVDSEFKNIVLGKEMASNIEDSTFVALFGAILLRAHTFLLVDERLVKCVDNDICQSNPLLEILEHFQ